MLDFHFVTVENCLCHCRWKINFGIPENDTWIYPPSKCHFSWRVTSTFAQQMFPETFSKCSTLLQGKQQVSKLIIFLGCAKMQLNADVCFLEKTWRIVICLSAYADDSSFLNSRFVPRNGHGRFAYQMRMYMFQGRVWLVI